MANDDSVDFKPPSGDDKGNDTNEIHINISEHEPLNDPNCEHKNVVKDPTEELGDAFTCQDCKLGWILTPADSPS